MNKILVEGIKLYAYHGCLEEEARIGGNYIVNVSMETNFDKAITDDELSSTIDYVRVYEIVKAEMAIRSKLIEHVGGRIIEKLKTEFTQLNKTEVKITKLNPPMNGDVERVSVVITG